MGDYWDDDFDPFNEVLEVELAKRQAPQSPAERNLAEIAATQAARRIRIAAESVERGEKLLASRRENLKRLQDAEVARVRKEQETAGAERLMAVWKHLGKVPNGTVVRFTTEKGQTYVALKAAGAWYLTQDGFGRSRKGRTGSNALARFIGASKLETAKHWS